MRLSRPGRRTAIVAVVVVVVLGALRLAAPPLANRLLVDRLEAYGVDATINNVSLNVFRGQLVAENAHGENTKGYGFKVKRLALAIDYLPLFSERLDFDYVRARNASVDVHRGPAGALSLGGVRIVAPAGQHQSSNWQLGFRQLDFDNVITTFTQSTQAGKIIRHRVRFRHSTANDVLFFEPGQPISIKANVQIDQGTLGVDGTFSPLGPHLTADFRLTSHAFALAQLAHLTERDSFKRVTAQADTDVQVTVDWPANAALSFQARGETSWNQPIIATPANLTARGDQFDWQGCISGKLLRGNDQPGEIDSDGTFKFDKLRVSQPHTLTVSSPQGRWHGKTTLRLKSAADQFNTKGMFSSPHLTFGVPKLFQVGLEQMHWHGQAGLGIGSKLIARHARGTLQAATNRLELAGAPLRFEASGFTFDGRYRSQPGPNGQALQLGIEANVNADRLIAINTRLNAYWAVFTDVRAQNMQADTLADFSIGRFQAKHTRLFQRPGQAATEPTDNAPIRVDALDAERAALTDQRAYAIDELGLSGVDLRLFRDPNGRIPAMRFFAGASKTREQAGASRSSAQPVTVAIKHATIGQNSSLRFRDASVSPEVQLVAHDLDVALDDVETGARDKPAKFRLSARIEKYGRIRSNGRLAANARGGPDGDMNARIRSLSLPPLSGYMNKLFNQGIRSGRLDATVDAKVNNGDLGGNLKVLLSNFYVDAGQSPRARASIGVPLSTALKTVRTDNDIIRLSMGLQGTLTSPHFSTADLVREALFAGLKNALMSNFSPVGWLHNIGSALAGLVGDKELHAVNFEKGSDDITVDSRVYLAKVRTVLKNHPAATLKLSGRAPTDRPRLAGARARAVHDYLAARGIDPARLNVEPAQTTGRSQPNTVSLTIHKGSSG